MSKFLSRHPDGAAGVALVLLRLSVALVVFAAFARLPVSSSDWITFLSAVIALALVVGLGTRIAALMLAGAAIVDALTIRGDLALIMVAHAVGSMALVMLGSGAYSIDALVFGRRVIRLNPRSPDRGTGD